MAGSIKTELNPCLSAPSKVIVEGDEAWGDALKRWTMYRFQAPAAVIQPANEKDVVATVRYSKYLALC